MAARARTRRPDNIWPGFVDALTTLLAFNLGVEVGQLVFVAAIFAPLAWSRGRPWFPMAARAVSAAVLVIAIWWGAERALMV